MNSLKVEASTWKRDSHGLYDYEKSNQITYNNLMAKNDFCKQMF